MKPTFKTLSDNYYSSNINSTKYVDGEDLYSEIGYKQADVKAGPYKGKKVETGAKLLADQLMRPDVFGRPELFKPSEFLSKVGSRKGVVLFWKITGYGGGHIDLIDIQSKVAVCNSACYFQSKEIWFWELK